MKARPGSAVIALDALRVGMYIHLELGWMSHPFALSHFKIASVDQIATLRGLGLKEVRWSPELSDLGDAPDAGLDTRPLAADPATPAAPLPREAANDATAARPADPAQQRRERAAADRAALEVCHRQFDEATRSLRELNEHVADRPAQAREAAQALGAALLNKMAGQHELCIRLLGEAAGDKASAHAVTVALLSMLMGRSFGWSDKEMMDLGVGALMHDVGKLELPERVRHRDEHFTAAESRYYEEHVARGVAQARRMGLSAGALLVIGQHHELADHSGFPLKIGSDRMTAAARIVALVDRYDKLCNPPRAHLALTPHEAVSLLFAQYQNKFDTTVLAAFVKMMGVYPPGSVVQLTDDRLALVVSVNSTRPLKPRVQVFDPGLDPEEQPLLDLESSPGLGIRRSLKPQALPRDALQWLSPRQRVAYFFEPVLPAGAPSLGIAA
jgi:putative nucleotidyltransferase with HDIG domain